MVKCTKRQIRQLKTALHWKIPDLQRQRIRMVLLREGNMTQPAIAAAMGVSLSTVNRAHMAYGQGGIKALKPKPCGGRQPQNMTIAAEQALLARFAKAAGAEEMLNIHDLKSAYEQAPERHKAARSQQVVRGNRTSRPRTFPMADRDAAAASLLEPIGLHIDVLLDLARQLDTIRREEPPQMPGERVELLKARISEGEDLRLSVRPAFLIRRARRAGTPCRLRKWRPCRGLSPR